MDDLHFRKKEFFDLIASMPETRNHPQFYDMSTEEKQKDLWRRIHFMHSDPELRKLFFDDYDPVAPPFLHWPFFMQGTLPGGMHVLMGYTAMACLADEE